MNSRTAIVVNAIKTENSVVACAPIAKFLASSLELELFDNPKFEPARRKYRTLIVVNSPWHFCGFRDRVAEYIKQAKRVVYVENDYSMAPTENAALSAWRKAGNVIDYWTTLETHKNSSSRSEYVNWNALFYKPLPKILGDVYWPSNSKATFYYYGALRPGRRKVFARYFDKDHVAYKLVIAAPSPRYLKRFEEAYPHAKIVGKVPDVGRWLRGTSYTAPDEGGATFTVYLEDDRAARSWVSLACRFYEALGAGTFQFIDEAAVKNIRNEGLYVDKEWIVGNSDDLVRKLRRGRKYLAEMHVEQISQWRAIRHRGRFLRQFGKAVKKQGRA